jgi:hypothetical protein
LQFFKDKPLRQGSRAWRLEKRRDEKMRIKQGSSTIFVGCLAVVATIVILSDGRIAAAGPRFNPQDAKGGLPACTDNLNEISANLETCETNLVEVQEEFSCSKMNLKHATWAWISFWRIRPWVRKRNALLLILLIIMKTAR